MKVISRIQAYRQNHGTAYTLRRLGQKAAQQLEKAATETATQATSATVDQVKSTQQQQPKTAPIKRNR